MHLLIEKLLAKGVTVTDGSWGTQLQRRNLGRGENPDSWNLLHPDVVEQIAQLYVDAGSRIILTNTFGANRFVLGKFGLADKMKEINVAGVEISKKAAKDKAYVFASIGPSGKMLLRKDVTREELYAAFEAQANSQAEAGADGIVIETMMDIEEAAIAVQAAKTTGLPVVGCMVFDAGKDKDRTMMGNTPEQAAQGLANAGADIVGANCGQGIEGFIPICKRLKTSAGLPVWIKANAGIPEMIGTDIVYKTTAAEFAASVPELINSGARFIGGCCGTDETFIKQICKIVTSNK